MPPPAANHSLRVQIRGAKGEPIAGSARWTHSTAPFAFLPRLEPSAVQLANAQRTVRRYPVHQGSIPMVGADLLVPSGAWTWVRVAWPVRGGERGVYRLVPPLCAPESVFVDSVAPSGGVHVMVYAAADGGPVCGARVVVEPGERRPRTLVEGVTDPNGYVRLAIDPDAPCAVRLEDPRAAESGRVALGPASCRSDRIVALVAGDRGKAVTLRCEVPDLPAQVCTLLLQRVDRPGAVILAVPELRSGRNEVDLELQAGAYRAFVVPQHLFMGEPASFVVEEASVQPQGLQINLARSPSIALEMRGIPAEELPLTVQLIDEEDLTQPDDLRIWSGPHRWHRLRDSVGSFDGARRVIACNRREVWLSTETVRTSPTILAAMAPGTRLDVRLQGLRREQRPALLEVEANGATCRRLLRPDLADSAEGVVPGMRASVYVARGAAEIRALDEDGRVMIAKDLVADSAVMVVELVLDRP